MKIKTPKGFWWAGSNEEWFTEGPFDSREEAIQEGHKAFLHDGFYIINGENYQISFSAEELIDSQYFDNSDYFCYENGNEPAREGPQEIIDKSNRELQTYLNKWIKKYNHTFAPPGLFAWSKEAEWIEGISEPQTDNRISVAESQDNEL